MPDSYRVDHLIYAGRDVIIDNGWHVRKEPPPGEAVLFMGVPLVWDPVTIASFDDEATARAVCKDLNAHG